MRENQTNERTSEMKEPQHSLTLAQENRKTHKKITQCQRKSQLKTRREEEGSEAAWHHGGGEEEKEKTPGAGLTLWGQGSSPEHWEGAQKLVTSKLGGTSLVF